MSATETDKRAEHITLLRQLTSTPVRRMLAVIEEARTLRLAQYAERPLQLFVRFDVSEHCRQWSTVAECADTAPTIARVLIPPGTDPATLRDALEYVAKQYERNFEDAQTWAGDHAAKLLGLATDAATAAPSEVPL